MPPKKFTGTQLRVTDIHDNNDTLQTVALIAKCATTAVLPEAEIDDYDDLNKDREDQEHDDSPIDNNIGDLRSQITEEDFLEMATPNRLMLQMLLENQTQ